jgi:hypothetical protein
MESKMQPTPQEIKNRSQDICYSCEGVLWANFFFDGFGYSISEAGGSGSDLSNIGKLFRSRDSDNRKSDRFAFFYPGLGARFEPELAVIAKTAGQRILKDGGEKAKDKMTPDNPLDKMQEGASDYLKDKAGDLATSPTADGVKDVFSSLGKDAEAAGNRVARHAKQIFARGVEGNINEGVRIAQRKLSGIMSHWRSLAVDVLRHPWRALKLAFVGEVLTWEGAKYVLGRVVEATPARDWKTVAGLFNTGVDIRLEAAEDDFKRAVGEARRKYTVKHINVAVFGYDNGGALAMAFANRLMNDICSKGQFDGIEVKLKFIGLFDCVAHRYSDNLLLGYVPISKAVVDELQIPKQAEKIVHLCAAHEFRFYKPLSIIKGKAELGAKYEEWLYPGSQADVGGGYADGDDGKSSQLARVALQFMHMQARRQAVPLLSLESLKSLPDKGPVYADFAVDDSIKKQVDAYRKLAFECAKQVVPITPQELTASMTMTSTQCIRGASLLKPMMRLPDGLKEELKGHQALFILWLRSLYDAASDKTESGFAELRKEMKQIDRAAAMGPLSGDLKELYSVWKSASGQHLPADIEPLFTKYIHNSMIEMDAGFFKSLVEQSDMLFFGPNQLHYRNTLEIEQQPEQDWLAKQKAYAQTINEIGPSGYPRATPKPSNTSPDSRIGL